MKRSNSLLRFSFIFVLLLGECTIAQLIPAPPKAAADTFLPDPKAPFLDFSKDWPDRWVPDNSTSRGVIVPLSSPASTMAVHFLTGAQERTAADEADFEALAKQFSDPAYSKLAWQIEGRNATPVESRKPQPKFVRTGEPDASLVFRFVSGTLSTSLEKPLITIERTTFALYEPLEDAAPTHLIVLLPGMFGTPQEILEPFILHCRRHNIAVLRMFSHPSRFTEEIVLAINPENQTQVDARAREIGTNTNSRLAECAYAIDAALHYVRDKRPATKTVPLVAVGGSGGAIILPTVCALHPSQWSGAVMIGSAADFWLVNQRSNYQNLIRALRVNWSTNPTQEQRQSLDTLYLQYATLDPFHTAKALAGIPIFLIQGQNDQAVPAALGSLLWDRLQPREKPSQLVSTPLTHESLFATLPARFDEISEWIKACK